MSEERDYTSDGNVVRPASYENVNLFDVTMHGGTGGPGDGGQMERRIENLETDMREVKKDLTDIKVTLAEIKTELGHKVSYKWLAIYFLGLAALVLKSEIAALFSTVSPP